MWTSLSSAIWDRTKNNHVFGPFSESSFGVIADVQPEGPSNAPWSGLNPTGEEALPSLFGNHPISSGFLRRISSRTIWPISTTEKDRGKPSSHFRHIYASVCTSYAAVCSPYALFRLEQEVRRE